MYSANLVIICETAFFLLSFYYTSNDLDSNTYKKNGRIYFFRSIRITPVIHTDDFILKVTVAKATEKLPENSGKLKEKLIESPNRLTENKDKLTKNRPFVRSIQIFFVTIGQMIVSLDFVFIYVLYFYDFPIPFLVAPT